MPSFNKFPVLSWDASYESHVDPPFEVRPVISFIPNVDFLEMAHRNNYFIPVLIKGTDIYDGIVWGVLNSNFHHKCTNRITDGKVYNITVRIEWKGYPYCNGTIEMINDHIQVPIGMYKYIHLK